jgi:hypothetical protein
VKIKVLVLIIILLVSFSFTSSGKYYLSQIHYDFQTEAIGYIGNQGNGFGQLQHLYLNRADFESNNENKSILLADVTPLHKEYDFTECKGKKVKVSGLHSFRTSRKEGIFYDLKSIIIINSKNDVSCLRLR